MTDDAHIGRTDRSAVRPRPMASVSDFSSSEYWSNRFSNETSFEWLLPSNRIVPFIIESLDYISPSANRQSFRGLHIGCGTSDLGRHVQQALNELHQGTVVEIVDADYVAGSISSEGVLPLDCLDEDDLSNKMPEGGWDMILDKSTADAISCGPLIHADHSDTAGKEPIFILLRNMARATRLDAKWVSISYSATRFDLPCLRQMGWEVMEKRFLASTSLPEGRRVKDEKTGEERVVWEPETGVWGWVLRRIESGM